MGADSGFSDEETREIVGEFIVESLEGLAQLDVDLVGLEREPSDTGRLRSVFRTVHTIKGTSGFLGFTHLEAIAHAGENLLSLLRDGKRLLDEEITTSLLAMVDTIRAILGHVEADASEGERDDGPLVAELARLSAGPSAAGEVPKPAPAAGEAAAAPPAPAPPAGPPCAEAPPAGRPFGQILVERGATTEPVVAAALELQKAGDPRHLGEILVDRGVIQPADVVSALTTQAETRSALSEAHVRVDVGLLDEMMDLVGELVLARNQILQYLTSQDESPLTAPTQRLNLITSELQERVMRTRMQSIGNVWSPFPRTVRDLARACGKQVRLEMEGQETELDRTIIEAVRDPFTHLLRNAVDHGIEPPDERTAAGKPAEGRLVLRAYHEGGRVNIEIVDDGSGIDAEKVRAAAVERRLVGAEQAAAMSEREVIDLLFQPGFSTAKAVTNLSGRGVGLDVVKTDIERIGGAIDVTTAPGAGTAITIRIPLTLAIIPALIVASGGQRYAIPQASLLELVRLDHSTRKRVEHVKGVPVYRLRGRLLPLVDLAEQLGTALAGPARTTTTIVVVRADRQSFGLIVDDVRDTEEIVVKPLGAQLKGIPVLSGVTIMGDGKVAVILDVTGIARRAGLLTGDAGSVDAAEAGGGAAEEGLGEALLVVSAGGVQLAVPQGRVDRLEEIRVSELERAGGLEAVQYRDAIMPLLRLGEIFGEPAEREADDYVQVVVVDGPTGQRLGLVVDGVVDFVDGCRALDRSTARPGTVGSAIVAGHVTELVDVEALASRLAMPAIAGAGAGRQR